MSGDLGFLNAAETLPTHVFHLLATAVQRMQNASVADAVAQNHAYAQGIINTCVVLEQLPRDVAHKFLSGALKLCCDRIAALATTPRVNNALRPVQNITRRVH